MKLFLLLLLPVFSLAQDTAISFTEVVEVPGQTKEQLFIKARQWLNDAIKSSKTALQIADKETGELSGKSYVYADWETQRGKRAFPQLYHFEFSIFVKEWKYKYIFSNFNEVESDGTSGWYGLMTSADTVLKKNPFMKPAKVTDIYRRQKRGLIEKVQALVIDLKEYMTKESKTDF